MINNIINYFFPLKCMNKYRNHEFIDKQESLHVGIGKFIDGKEITEIRNIHYRECKRCKHTQRWDSWSGWELYVTTEKMIIAEKLLKYYFKTKNK